MVTAWSSVLARPAVSRTLAWVLALAVRGRSLTCPARQIASASATYLALLTWPDGCGWVDVLALELLLLELPQAAMAKLASTSAASDPSFLPRSGPMGGIITRAGGAASSADGAGAHPHPDLQRPGSDGRSQGRPTRRTAAGQEIGPGPRIPAPVGVFITQAGVRLRLWLCQLLGHHYEAHSGWVRCERCDQVWNH